MTDLKLPTVESVFAQYLNPKTRRASFWSDVAEGGYPDSMHLTWSLLEDVDGFRELAEPEQEAARDDFEDVACEAIELFDAAMDDAAWDFSDAVSDADDAVLSEKPAASRLPSDVLITRAERRDLGSVQSLACVAFCDGLLGELYNDLADLRERL